MCSSSQARHIYDRHGNLVEVVDNRVVSAVRSRCIDSIVSSCRESILAVCSEEDQRYAALGVLSKEQTTLYRNHIFDCIAERASRLLSIERICESEKSNQDKCDLIEGV